MEETKINKEEVLENMAQEIIVFLKKKKMWKTDTGIIYNGKHVDHKGIEERQENLSGDMRMWFEGSLNHALNYGTGDKDFSIYKGLEAIMEKHGYYPQFYSNCDFNIYPI